MVFVCSRIYVACVLGASALRPQEPQEPVSEVSPEGLSTAPPEEAFRSLKMHFSGHDDDVSQDGPGSLKEESSPEEAFRHLKMHFRRDPVESVPGEADPSTSTQNTSIGASIASTSTGEQRLTLFETVAEEVAFPMAETLKRLFINTVDLKGETDAGVTDAESSAVTQDFPPLPDPATKNVGTGPLPDPRPIDWTKESTAAKESKAWQQFRKERPRHPSFPNSSDRHAEVWVVAFLFFFIASWVFTALFYVETLMKYAHGFKADVYNMLPFAIPPMIVWMFALGVVNQTWHKPVRGVLKYESHEYSACCEMLGYLITGTLFSIFDLTVQIIFRLYPTVELRSFAFCSILANLGINTWGAFLSFTPSNWSYCTPLLSYTVLLFCCINLFCILFILILLVASVLYVHYRVGQQKRDTLKERFQQDMGGEEDQSPVHTIPDPSPMKRNTDIAEFMAGGNAGRIFGSVTMIERDGFSQSFSQNFNAR